MAPRLKIRERKMSLAQRWRLSCLALLLALTGWLAVPRVVNAYYICYGVCVATIIDQAELWVAYEAGGLADIANLAKELLSFEFDWLDNTFYGDDVKPVLQNMAAQFSAVMMQETLALGTFFDVKNQLETQTLFQELNARAHKDYQPSFGMCVFGTNTGGLAAADMNGTLTEKTLSQQGMQRELQSGDVAGVNGPRSDRDSRLAKFADRYCDRLDNDANAGNVFTGLGKICSAKPQPETLNRDIDYMRTLLLPRTLNIDFSDSNITGDEQDIIAMRQNLYSHQLFSNVAPAIWAVNANRPVYLDMRSVIAKRGVAEMSFDAIAGMKSSGAAPSEETAKYMGVLLSELGMPATDIAQFLGSRPSYLAQMEVLAKKMYQRPEFYTELYESPANVARRGVAMQAIGTMLDRDIFKSHLRSEAILSLILEARLQPLQDAVDAAAPALPVSAP